ncbi:hypothetical protein ACFLZW_05805 [Chloroflexota bacterium]
MKRLVIMTILKMCGEAVLLTIFAGIVIGILGYLNKWDASIKYSNAFFIAGCLLIIAGTSSRYAAGQDRVSFQSLHTESFRDMNSGERANFMVDASSSLHLVILGLLSGISLIVISAFVTRIF